MEAREMEMKNAGKFALFFCWNGALQKIRKRSDDFTFLLLCLHISFFVLHFVCTIKVHKKQKRDLIINSLEFVYFKLTKIPAIAWHAGITSQNICIEFLEIDFWSVFYIPQYFPISSRKSTARTVYWMPLPHSMRRHKGFSSHLEKSKTQV